MEKLAEAVHLQYDRSGYPSGNFDPFRIGMLQIWR